MIKIIPSIEENSTVELEDDEFGEILEKPDGYVITQCDRVLPPEYVMTTLGGYFIRDELVAGVVEE